MARFVSLEPNDVRFPTSRHRDGWDAMNPEPGYAAADVVVRTDADDVLPTWGPSPASWPTIRSCAGWGPRTAWCAWRATPWSRGLTPQPTRRLPTS
jgi:hypothetical protein